MSHPAVFTRIAIALLSFSLVSCTQGGEKLDGREVPAAKTAPATPAAESHEPGMAGGFSLAGVSFTPPADWTDQGPSGMRKASFSYGPVEGDSDPAECTVFYFGSGQGGDIESNISRWVGQMEPAEGETLQSAVRRSQLTTENGLGIHFVEVDGTFMKSMGGGPMTGGRTKPMEGWRMVGAIVQAPEGNVFFKLVGPEATVREMEPAYRTMLGSAKQL
jgi:hypothetical protein